jgi:multidrug resistance efflux pump
MTGANRLRAIPWVLGVCLVAASLIGANRLLHQPDSVNPDGGGAGQPARNGGPVLAGALIVHGHVDSDPSPAEIGPPAVAAMSTVKKVLVAEGQEVKPGDPLVQFDDAQARAKLEQAEAELAAARIDIKKAEIAKQAYAVQLKGLEAAARVAKEQLDLAEDSLKVGQDRLEQALGVERDFTTGQPLTEAQKEKRRKEEPELRRLRGMVNEARAKSEAATTALETLRLDPVEQQYQQALAKVKRLEATVQEAQAAVDAHLVKAPKDIGGVVEQLKAVEGMTFGPTTRHPVLTLVPAGKRTVRAEVQAEFAYKLAGVEGKKVTIYDDTNFALTYQGTVRRVATAFLPRRAADVALTVSPTKVLEVVIDVTDPAPSGRSPLRVGQPVRVAFE